MLNIKIYLKEDGDILRVDRDFDIYAGEYQNKLLSFYVPKSLVASNYYFTTASDMIVVGDNNHIENYEDSGSDNVNLTALQFARKYVNRTGKITFSGTFYAHFNKEVSVGGKEYVLFSRTLPYEMTLNDTAESVDNIMVLNVINITRSPVYESDVIVGYKNTSYRIVATNEMSLPILPSQYLNGEPIDDASEYSAIVNELQGELDQLKDAVDDLEDRVVSDFRYIGTLTNIYNPSTQFDTIIALFPALYTSVGLDYAEKENGDTIIYVQELALETDKNYKFIYTQGGWDFYEIPPMELASNFNAGLIKGGTIGRLSIDIQTGLINDIKVDNTSLPTIIDGLMTKDEGATKQFVREYALPANYANLYFIETAGYADDVPSKVTPQFSNTITNIGTQTVFSLQKLFTEAYRINKNNAIKNEIYVESDQTIDVEFTLTTSIKGTTASIIRSGTKTLTAGEMQKIDFAGNLIQLGATELEVEVGDVLQQVLQVTVQTLTVNTTLDLYSNSTYPSTFSFAVACIGADVDTTYTAGYGLSLDGTEFSADTEVLATQSDLADKQDKLTQTQLDAVNSGIDSTKVEQIATNAGDIEDIQELIPEEATDQNQLADKEFVNSSIGTNTANFIGTFANIPALLAYAGTITNNDYAFVTNSVITDNGNDWATFSDLDDYDKDLLTEFDYAWVVNSNDNTKFDLYRFDIENQQWVLRVSETDKASVTLNSAYNRYKYNGSTEEWLFEYTLNNSSFTASQWASINSGITANGVTQIGTNANNISDLQTNKQDKLVAGTNITIDQLTNTISASGGSLTGSSNPTTATAGEVGQFYLNTATGVVFVCLGESGGLYSWEVINIIKSGSNVVYEIAFDSNNKLQIIVGNDGATKMRHYENGSSYEVQLPQWAGVLACINQIFPTYSSSAPYSVGDLVNYNNLFYRCTTAVTTPEAFDNTKWTQTTLVDELKSKANSNNVVTLDTTTQTVSHGKTLNNNNAWSWSLKSSNTSVTTRIGSAGLTIDTDVGVTSGYSSNTDINYKARIQSYGNWGGYTRYVALIGRAFYIWSNNTAKANLLLPDYSDIGNGQVATIAMTKDIFPAFSTSTNYVVGDLVTYEGNFYRCTTAHSAGAWVAGDFTATTLVAELNAKQTTLTTSSVSSGTINEAIGFDGNGNLVRGTAGSGLEALTVYQTEDIVNATLYTCYDISVTATNGTYVGNVKIPDNGTAEVVITADSGYSLPVSVTVSGATYTWDSTTGRIELSAPTGNVSITVVCA